jgi:hypothetical protein
MMIASYWLGKKFYPVPYPLKKLTVYILVAIGIYMLHVLLKTYVHQSLWFSITSAVMLIIIFARFIGKMEAKEFSKLPLIGKLYQ